MAPEARAAHASPVPHWRDESCREHHMSTEQQNTEQQNAAQAQDGQQAQKENEAQQLAQQQQQPNDFDGLKDKKPDELTPEELRLMADTMPGEGPGD
jgi:hypothetical protein